MKPHDATACPRPLRYTRIYAVYVVSHIVALTTDTNSHFRCYTSSVHVCHLPDVSSPMIRLACETTLRVLVCWHIVNILGTVYTNRRILRSVSMGSSQCNCLVYTSFRRPGRWRSCISAAHVNARFSEAASSSAFSWRVSLHRLYSSLHIEHSSQSNIISTFLTCWMLAEKGSVYFLKRGSEATISGYTKQFLKWLVVAVVSWNRIR